jgi:quercetin dioxygenase-like cupin family protein
MWESDFIRACNEDRKRYIARPYDEIAATEVTPGSLSRLIAGENLMISFLTMKAGSTFELHSHSQEQIMIVVEGYCDELIENKMYRVEKGDVIYLPANIKHGAFIRDTDCLAIDIFSPPRDDYKRKYREQNRGKVLHFIRRDEQGIEKGVAQ